MNLASLADAPQLPRADHIADDPPRPHEESSRFQSWPHRFFSASSRCPLPVFIFLRSSLRVSREGGAVTPYTVTGIYISSRDRDHEIPRNNTKICGPALSFLGDASLLSASDVERRSRAILRAFPPHARVSRRAPGERVCPQSLVRVPRTSPSFSSASLSSGRMAHRSWRGRPLFRLSRGRLRVATRVDI